MKRRIVYLVNPISGTKGKESLIQKLAEKTESAQIPFDIIYTNAAGNYYFLKNMINEEGVTDIVVCGGDGTINKVAAALIDEVVNIGIIPMGSGNGLAFSAKIPGNIDKALKVIFAGKAAYVDAFFINDAFSCMLCGLGLDAKVAHDFAAQKKRGLSTYVKQSFINFLQVKPWTFELINKGIAFTTDAYFISIANSNQFGNQFTIAPKASLNDGLLDIIVVQKMSKLRMIWAVLQQVRSGKIMEYSEHVSRRSNVLYFQTDKLIIHNRQGAPLHIDGDPSITAGKFIIEVVPDAFKLLQPM